MLIIFQFSGIFEPEFLIYLIIQHFQGRQINFDALDEHLSINHPTQQHLLVFLCHGCGSQNETAEALREHLLEQFVSLGDIDREMKMQTRNSRRNLSRTRRNLMYPRSALLRNYRAICESKMEKGFLENGSLAGYCSSLAKNTF